MKTPVVAEPAPQKGIATNGSVPPCAPQDLAPKLSRLEQEALAAARRAERAPTLTEATFERERAILESLT
jgi:hypothetical protein